jgi:hypothetical protein
VRVVYVTHTARRSGAEIALVRFLAATRERISATVPPAPVYDWDVVADRYEAP